MFIGFLCFLQNFVSTLFAACCAEAKIRTKSTGSDGRGLQVSLKAKRSLRGDWFSGSDGISINRGFSARCGIGISFGFLKLRFLRRSECGS